MAAPVGCPVRLLKSADATKGAMPVKRLFGRQFSYALAFFAPTDATARVPPEEEDNVIPNDLTAWRYYAGRRAGAAIE
jgi:hypothetical protein